MLQINNGLHKKAFVAKWRLIEMIENDNSISELYHIRGYLRTEPIECEGQSRVWKLSSLPVPDRLSFPKATDAVIHDLEPNSGLFEIPGRDELLIPFQYQLTGTKTKATRTYAGEKW